MPRYLRLALLLLGASGVPYCRAQPAFGQDALQPMPCGPVVAPVRAYSLKLSSFAPGPNQVSGALIQARVNGGPPLHLLLDSGASHITLDAKASARSGISAVSESRLVGLGESPAGSVRSGVAGAVDVGPLQFRNCRVDMAPGGLAGGIDGVIPLSLFGSFLIRLDLPGKVLDLMPYPERGAAQTAGFARAIQKDDLLFMRGSLNDALEGYILLDTGASYSAISQPAAQTLKSSSVSPVGLRGANGAVNGDRIADGIRYRVAGRSLTAEPVAALDLAVFSAFHGVETIGVLGYPALRGFILTISYRDALVRIDNPASRAKAPTLMADNGKADAR